MTTMFRALSFAGVTLAAFVALVPEAQACKCMMPTPEMARDQASAVFEGQVSEIQHQPPGGPSGVGGTNLVTLKLVRTWKGVENLETVQLSTSDSSASCGISFENGKSYLVYASTSEQGGLQTGACSRTQELAAASEDLAVLGGGVTPVKVDAPKAEDKAEQAPAEPPRTRSGGCASSSSASASASLALLMPAFGLVLSGRRRRDRRD